MCRRYLTIILCIMLILTFSPTFSFGSSDVVHEEVNGQFILSVLQGEQWIDAGRLDFGRFYSEKQIDIADYIKTNEELKLKITKIGGGSSHIDAVLLEDKVPILSNNGDEKELTKVKEADLDVINVDEEGLVFSFNAQPGDKILKVFGRIEMEVIRISPIS